MSWDSYVANLMARTGVDDAAILGLDPPSVWASNAGGKFASITAQEIQALAQSESSRKRFMAEGITLGGGKCTVLRDSLDMDQDFTMDIRTKACPDDPSTYSICIAKSQKALVIVRAKKDVHGGMVNPYAHEIAKYLRKSGY